MSDPRFPAPESVDLGRILRRRAAAHPDRTFAVFADGATWTYGAAEDIAARTAAGLASLGLTSGDRVACWLPNGPDIIQAWFGANWLGATYVPLNVALRGGVLDHVLQTSHARVLVAHVNLIHRLRDRELGSIDTVIVVGVSGDQGSLDLDGLPDRCRVAPWSSISEGRERAPAADIDPTSTQSIIFTSGTTGPSKGVLSSYIHLWASSSAAFEGHLESSDRYLVNLPLFHAGGTLGVFGMLVRGGSIAVVDSFSTGEFWDVVRTLDVTACTLLGVMATFLAKQAPDERDTDHPLRLVYMVPLTEDPASFSTRFGVDVVTLFNMTEVSCPLVSEVNPVVRGTCGRPRAGIDARLVDSDDAEVFVGEIGELILRADLPWSMNHGYDGMPEATAAAWRNGWFHTGDAFRRDIDGNFFFVDRIKDAIRRRGENISSFEVEAEVLAHPDIREAAAIAVPSAIGEDEVLVAISTNAGTSIAPDKLLDFLIPRMAHFMVPRYVRMLDELPKTPTNKIEKHLLRSQGVTPDTWDREAAGFQVRRERLK